MKAKLFSKHFSGLDFALKNGKQVFDKSLKNKIFAVVNSNNLHQLCWH